VICADGSDDLSHLSLLVVWEWKTRISHIVLESCQSPHFTLLVDSHSQIVTQADLLNLSDVGLIVKHVELMSWLVIDYLSAIATPGFIFIRLSEVTG
jgi:hypothetical protein